MTRMSTIQRLLSVVLLLVGALSLSAQVRSVPTGVKAAPGQSSTSVIITWTGIGGDPAPMKYYVYQASGITEDMSKFSRIATVAHNPNARENAYSFVAQVAKAGTYTFYVSGYWADGGEGGRSAIATVELTEGETPVIRFVSLPVVTATIGKPYTYQTKIVTSSSGPVTYRLESNAVGMTISDGGLVTWNEPKAGRYEVYVRAVVTKDGKDYETKQAYVLTVGDGKDGAFKFLTEPIKIGTAGRAYVYPSRAGVVDGSAAVTYEFVAGPKGMTVDKTSGLVKWESPVAGRYEIVIAATAVINGQSTTIKQSYVLEIKEGETPKKGCSKIYGSISYDDPTAGGKLEGIVTAWRLQKVTREGNSSEVYQPVYKAEINADGKYFLYVPEGTYKLRVEGRNFFAEWHENVTEVSEAKDVTAVCDVMTEINFAVARRPEPVLVVVEGRVYDAATNEVVKGVVVFESRGKENNAADDRYRSVVAEVRSDGTYEAKVQSGVGYIAMVRPVPTKESPNASQYLAEFWENTNDATKATVLTVSANTKNIDFPMDKRVARNNGFTGAMKNFYTGAPVVGKVVAHRLVTRTNDKGDTVLNKITAVTVETNAGGGFMFTDLEPGEYVVLGLPAGRPFVPGWMVTGQKAVTEWGKAQRVGVGDYMVAMVFDINLDTVKPERGKGRVRGFVYDKRGGIVNNKGEVVQQSAGVPGTLVVARDEDGTIIDFSLAENEGAFDLTNLAVGSMTIAADRFDFEPTVQTVDIDASTPERVVSIGLRPTTSSVDVPLNEVGTTLNLWPNPTTGDATVRFNARAGEAMVSIVSVSGVELARFATVVAAGEVSIALPTAELPTGMVMVHVTNGPTAFALPLNIVR